MEKYMTDQRRLLLDFLREHNDRQYSVDDIAEKLCGQGISKSAVYRNIDKLVKEGCVQKSAVDGSRRFLYRYVEGKGCCEHLHLKCVSCGRMYHLDCATSDVIIKLANSRGFFKVNGKLTILYGMCASCE